MKPRGKIPIGNVSNIEMHTLYSFALGFWVRLADRDPLIETTTYYGLEPISGPDFKDNNDFDILVGMDVIAQGDLSIRRDGTFEFVLP